MNISLNRFTALAVRPKLAGLILLDLFNQIKYGPSLEYSRESWTRFLGQCAYSPFRDSSFTIHPDTEAITRAFVDMLVQWVKCDANQIHQIISDAIGHSCYGPYYVTVCPRSIMLRSETTPCGSLKLIYKKTGHDVTVQPPFLSMHTFDDLLGYNDESATGKTADFKWINELLGICEHIESKLSVNEPLFDDRGWFDLSKRRLEVSRPYVIPSFRRVPTFVCDIWAEGGTSTLAAQKFLGLDDKSRFEALLSKNILSFAFNTIVREVEKRVSLSDFVGEYVQQGISERLRTYATVAKEFVDCLTSDTDGEPSDGSPSSID